MDGRGVMDDLTLSLSKNNSSINETLRNNSVQLKSIAMSGEQESDRMGGRGMEEGEEGEMQLFDYVFFFFMPILTLVGVTGNILVLVIGE